MGAQTSTSPSRRASSWIRWAGWSSCRAPRTLAVIPNFAIDYTLKYLGGVDAEDLERLDLTALRTRLSGQRAHQHPEPGALHGAAGASGAAARRDQALLRHGRDGAHGLVHRAWRVAGRHRPQRAARHLRGEAAGASSRCGCAPRTGGCAASASWRRSSSRGAASRRRTTRTSARSGVRTASTRREISASSRMESCSSPAASMIGSRSTGRATSPVTSSRPLSGCRSSALAGRWSSRWRGAWWCSPRCCTPPWWSGAPRASSRCARDPGGRGRQRGAGRCAVHPLRADPEDEQRQAPAPGDHRGVRSRGGSASPRRWSCARTC